jgi:hypothetical protein
MAAQQVPWVAFSPNAAAITWPGSIEQWRVCLHGPGRHGRCERCHDRPTNIIAGRSTEFAVDTTIATCGHPDCFAWK